MNANGNRRRSIWSPAVANGARFFLTWICAMVACCSAPKPSAPMPAAAASKAHMTPWQVREKDSAFYIASEDFDEVVAQAEKNPVPKVQALGSGMWVYVVRVTGEHERYDPDKIELYKLDGTGAIKITGGTIAVDRARRRVVVSLLVSDGAKTAPFEGNGAYPLEGGWRS